MHLTNPTRELTKQVLVFLIGAILVLSPFSAVEAQGADISNPFSLPGKLCTSLLDITGTVPGIQGGNGACLSGLVYIFSVGLTAPLAYISATLFEYMLAFSLNGTNYAQSVVSIGWTVTRDLANMLFLFALVYISFSLILGVQEVNARKILTHIIIAALLINFSFFLSRVVVDAGNLLALQFYNAIQAESIKGETLRVFGFAVSERKALTTAIMSGVNPQALLASKQFAQWEKSTDFFTSFTTLSVLFLSMGAMLAILAYAFLAAAIKFVVRVVTLWFTIILSPFAFVMWALPGGQVHFKKWWTTHLNSALFPAGFLFVFYILVIFMGQAVSSGIFEGLFTQTWSDGTGIQAIALGITGVLIRVIFVVALLLLAVKAGDWFSVYGTNSINAFAWNQTVGRAERWGKKTGGFVFSQTAGRGAAMVDKAIQGTRLGNLLPLDFTRRMTTEKVAKLGLGGAESFKEFFDDSKKQDALRASNLRDIGNRDALRRASGMTDPAWATL